MEDKPDNFMEEAQTVIVNRDSTAKQYWGEKSNDRWTFLHPQNTNDSSYEILLNFLDLNI